MTDQVKPIQQLQTQLSHLQDRSTVVLADLRKSNEIFRKHFCQLYLWWRGAQQEEHWLETQYSSLGRRFRSVSYGINFGPLFWLVWGNSSGLTNQKADRYSRAMNALHQEFERHPALYAKDGPAKLAYFIQQAGGLTELAGYSPPQDNVSEENEVSAVTTDQVADRRAAKTALLELAENLQEFGEHQYVPFPAYISTNEQNYSVLLVKHTRQGLDLIATIADSELITTVLAETIRRRFDASVFALRPLLELIQTQCLPQHLEGLAKRLTDRATLDDGTKRKYTAYRRVLYLPSKNQFVLSPVNALSGVVSHAVPNLRLILADCEKDVFLPVRERFAIEKYLLRNFEFNLYNVELPAQTIPRYDEPDSASHAVTLRHRLNPNQFVGLNFWPFYNTLEQPQDQLDVDPDYVLEPLWEAQFSKDAFKRLNDEFLNKWLRSHGHHLARESNALLRVTFSKTHWQIEFVFQEGRFEKIEQIEIVPIWQEGSTISVLFQSKDWVPVMQSLACLPIVDPDERDKQDEPHDLDNEMDDDGSYFPFKIIVPDELSDWRAGVFLELNQDVLRVKFDTTIQGGSQHSIYIPTTDERGQRATQPFLRYQPQITQDLTPSITDDRDDLEQINEEWPEAMGIEP